MYNTPGRFKDALCPQCQRIIVSGAYYNSAHGDYEMRVHPAAGVQIDVGQSNWQKRFQPTVHTICKRTNLLAERIIF